MKIIANAKIRSSEDASERKAISYDRMVVEEKFCREFDVAPCRHINTSIILTIQDKSSDYPKVLRLAFSSLNNMGERRMVFPELKIWVDAFICCQ